MSVLVEHHGTFFGDLMPRAGHEWSLDFLKLAAHIPKGSIYSIYFGPKAIPICLL